MISEHALRNLGAWSMGEGADIAAPASADRVRAEMLRLSHGGLNVRSPGVEALSRLRRAVPFDAWCWPTADPATSLIIGAVSVDIPEHVAPRFFELEYQAGDFKQFSDLARCGRRVGLLSTPTANRLERSPRFQEIFGPLGFGDDLRAARVADGSCWGYLALHRERGSPHFAASEARFVARLSEHLGECVGTALVIGSVATPAAPDGPGLLVLERDLSLASVTPVAQRWLDELADEDRPRPRDLPYVVYAVISRLRALDGADGVALPMLHARLPTRNGRWLVVCASRLLDPLPASRQRSSSRRFGRRGWRS
jgi:hypothetical protein